MGIPEALWYSPPEQLALGDDEVHVWLATLDLPASHIYTLEQTLTDDEKKRVQEYRFQKDRTHFIAARGILRAILGRYLTKASGMFRFHYNEYGKPFLAEETNNSLSFNLAHSHGMAMYAIARKWDVGIDLEYISKDIACEQIAAHFFSPYEIGMLRAVPPERQYEAFFNCWTRKEAYIKARGMGLSLSLSDFDVSLIPGTPAALLNIREGNQHVSDWSLLDMSFNTDYAAALAVKGPPFRLQCWQWVD